MTKLEIQAICQLPRRFVRDGTSVTMFTPSRGPARVVAINPAYAPIVYWPRKGWRRLRWKQSPIEHGVEA